MRTYSLGKGRKKAVQKFRTRDGIWMVAIVTGGMITIVLLWMIGFFRFDAD
jgi:hypothetical protein